MSERIIHLVVKWLPYSIRYRIVLNELVRTPRGDYNADGLTVEELIRNMQKTRKGNTVADTVRITQQNMDELVRRVNGRKVIERYEIKNSGDQDGETVVHAFNLRTRGGDVERAYAGDILLIHENGEFGLISQNDT